MSFAVIDIDGSTVDTFDDAESTLAFLTRLRGQGTGAIDDLGVVEYQAGSRVGPPRLASDLIEKSDFSRIKVAVALARSDSDIRVEHILADQSFATPILIDISTPAEDPAAGAWEAIQRSSSHQYSLAA